MVFPPWMQGHFSHVPSAEALWYLRVELCDNLVSGEARELQVLLIITL